MKSLFLGLGKSNQSLASVLQGDKKALVEKDGKVEVYSFADEWKLESSSEGNFDDFDFKAYLPAQVFISPGVDPRRKFFKKVSKHEIRELDYFSENFKGQIIAITGTDGKSTFTTRLGEVLRRALPDSHIFVGGNLGTAMGEGLKEDYNIAVIEVSSFQAERLKKAHPDVAILLNLSTDHMDRYDKVYDYHKAKWGLLERAKLCVYPTDLAGPTSVGKSEVGFTSREESFSLLKKVAERLTKLWPFELKDEFFNDLPDLPHRLEQVKDYKNRLFVNDSKATTVHSVRYGINALRKSFPSLKIALGGRSKGDDFSKLLDILCREDEIYVFGEARDVIQGQLEGFEGKIQSFVSLADLLDSELEKVTAGNCFLFSPGCSSFDEFKNFEERGEFFLKKVKERVIL
jgi:UDP-N-acetylmuramoylalanine--D-glutamate ligase